MSDLQRSQTVDLDNETGSVLEIRPSLSHKQSPRTRSNNALDVALLKEIMVARAHMPPFGKQAGCFEKVAQKLNASNVLPWKTDFKHLIDRYRLILGAYRSNDRKGQSASGVEEEFEEREQLLEDIRNMIDDEMDRTKNLRDSEA